MQEKGKNNQTTWKSILVKGGSVQHLDFLSEEEKAVFKTFGEISQKEIVIQALSFFEKNDNSFSKEWVLFNKLFDKKNISRKECLLLPFKALSKALNFK